MSTVVDLQTVKVSMSQDEKHDESILARIASGDESAVGDCLDQFGGLVWSLAKRMCPHDAEDATQEIFVEVWQSASRYRPERGTEATFISMIARRRLIDRLRQKGLDVVGSQDDDQSTTVASLEDVDRLELADEAAKAADCMSQLSARQQEILTLSIHHGVSHSRISDRLSMPLGTVKSFARRALIQLRDCMGRPAAANGGIS